MTWVRIVVVSISGYGQDDIVELPDETAALFVRNRWAVLTDPPEGTSGSLRAARERLKAFAQPEFAPADQPSGGGKGHGFTGPEEHEDGRDTEERLDDSVFKDVGIAKPKPADPKQAWIDYAVKQGWTEDQATAVTKADLMSRWGSRLH